MKKLLFIGTFVFSCIFGGYFQLYDKSEVTHPLQVSANSTNSQCKNLESGIRSDLFNFVFSVVADSSDYRLIVTRCGDQAELDFAKKYNIAPTSVFSYVFVDNNKKLTRLPYYLTSIGDQPLGITGPDFTSYFLGKDSTNHTVLVNLDSSNPTKSKVIKKFSGGTEEMRFVISSGAVYYEGGNAYFYNLSTKRSYLITKNIMDFKNGVYQGNTVMYYTTMPSGLGGEISDESKYTPRKVNTSLFMYNTATNKSKLIKTLPLTTILSPGMGNATEGIDAPLTVIQSSSIDTNDTIFFGTERVYLK